MNLFKIIPDRLAALLVDGEGEAVGGGGGISSPATPSEGGDLSTGASPSPSGGGDIGAQPDAAPPTPGSEFTLTDDVMFAGDLDSIEIPAEPTVPTASAVPAAPTATPQPAPQPQAQPQPAKPAVAQQPAQQQPTQPQGVGGAPSRPPTSPELLQMVLQNRATILNELASKRFTLSQAEQDELETNAVGAIPKLLSRVYFDAYTSAMHYINQQVPTMIASHITESKRDTDAENDFYSAWPGIDKAKYGQDVYNFADAFRKLNPSASLKDAIQFTGSAVVAKHGLQNAGKPAAPVRPGAPSRRSAPFAPAAGGRTVSTAPVEESPFAGMGMNFDE